MTDRAAPVPALPVAIAGAALLGAGVAVLAIGALVGPDSDAPLFWGLLLCIVALPLLLGALRTFREAQAAQLGDDVPERSPVPGIVITLLPIALSGGLLAADPAPWPESVHAVALAISLWGAASLWWQAIRSRLDGPHRMPGVVRFVWPMVPGLALLAYALTAPGSNAQNCQDGATCYEGPIALSIPALLVLIGGVIAGVVGAKGSSADKTARFAFNPMARPASIDGRLERLAELGRLRSAGVIDRAEFLRLKAEVVGTDPDPS